MDYVPQAINFVSALGQGFNRENQKFFPISLGNKFHEANFFFIEYTNVLFIFFANKTFQNFVKLLTKIKNLFISLFF